LGKGGALIITMTLEIQSITIRKELVIQFPIMLKVMTDKETKEYHLKKLCEMSGGRIKK
jgi:hypothetical protein